MTTDDDKISIEFTPAELQALRRVISAGWSVMDSRTREMGDGSRVE